VTAPTAEPITIAEARAQVRVTDALSDAKLASLIFAAREWAQGVTKRVFMEQTWDYSLDGFPYVIKLPFGPVSSVMSITYYDASNALQTLSASVYDADVRSLVAKISQADGYSWPDTYDRYNAVTVRFVAGYPANHPDLLTVREAMLLHVEAHYDRDASNFKTLMDAAETLLSPLVVVRF
jgi:uncharacterized phiE125 gp8 family phage protein